MDNMNLMATGSWIGLFSTALLIICFYFTLTFFQHLKSDDERLIKQSKIAAVFCLALGLSIPALYSFYIYHQMMK